LRSEGNSESLRPRLRVEAASVRRQLHRRHQIPRHPLLALQLLLQFLLQVAWDNRQEQEQVQELRVMSVQER
jgi:hypothetical protein